MVPLGSIFRRFQMVPVSSKIIYISTNIFEQQCVFLPKWFRLCNCIGISFHLIYVPGIYFILLKRFDLIGIWFSIFIVCLRGLNRSLGRLMSFIRFDPCKYPIHIENVVACRSWRLYRRCETRCTTQNVIIEAKSQSWIFGQDPTSRTGRGLPSVI